MQNQILAADTPSPSRERSYSWGGKRIGSGRPKGPRGAIKATPATLRRLKEAGRLQCSDAETASYLGLGTDQLARFLGDNPAAQRAFADSKLATALAIRDAQLKLAEAGDPLMLAFLGAQMLGQHAAVSVAMKDKAQPIPADPPAKRGKS